MSAFDPGWLAQREISMTDSTFVDLPRRLSQWQGITNSRSLARDIHPLALSARILDASHFSNLALNALERWNPLYMAASPFLALANPVSRNGAPLHFDYRVPHRKSRRVPLDAFTEQGTNETNAGYPFEPELELLNAPFNQERMLGDLFAGLSRRTVEPINLEMETQTGQATFPERVLIADTARRESFETVASPSRSRVLPELAERGSGQDVSPPQVQFWDFNAERALAGATLLAPNLWSERGIALWHDSIAEMNPGHAALMDMTLQVVERYRPPAQLDVEQGVVNAALPHRVYRRQTLPAPLEQRFAPGQSSTAGHSEVRLELPGGESILTTDFLPGLIAANQEREVPQTPFGMLLSQPNFILNEVVARQSPVRRDLPIAAAPLGMQNELTRQSRGENSTPSGSSAPALTFPGAPIRSLRAPTQPASEITRTAVPAPTGAQFSSALPFQLTTPPEQIPETKARTGEANLTEPGMFSSSLRPIEPHVRQDWLVLDLLPQLDMAPETPAPGAVQVLRKLAATPQTRTEMIDALQSLPMLGIGEPIPVSIQPKMEALTHRDLADVRVYTSPAAETLGAAAFTTGNRIVFAPGRKEFSSPQGLGLLGHEIAHIGQPLGFQLTSTAEPGTEDDNERAAQQQEQIVRRNYEQPQYTAPQMDLRHTEPAQSLAAQSQTGGDGAWSNSGSDVTNAQVEPGLSAPEPTLYETPAASPTPGGDFFQAPTANGASPAGSAGAPDMDMLARQVYILLKDQLRSERDRHELYSR